MTNYKSTSFFISKLCIRIIFEFSHQTYNFDIVRKTWYSPSIHLCKTPGQIDVVVWGHVRKSSELLQKYEYQKGSCAFPMYEYKLLVILNKFYQNNTCPNLELIWYCYKDVLSHYTRTHHVKNRVTWNGTFKICYLCYVIFEDINLTIIGIANVKLI